MILLIQLHLTSHKTIFTSLLCFLLFALGAQVNSGLMEDIVICGEPSLWTLTTDEAGTVSIRKLPPGIEFVNFESASCNVNYTSSNPPTFYAPGPCSITYSVQAKC